MTKTVNRTIHPANIADIQRRADREAVSRALVDRVLPLMEDGKRYSLQEMTGLFRMSTFGLSHLHGLFRHMLTHGYMGISNYIRHEKATPSYVCVDSVDSHRVAEVRKAIREYHEVLQRMGVKTSPPPFEERLNFFSGIAGKGWFRWQDAERETGISYRLASNEHALNFARGSGFQVKTYKGKSGFYLKQSLKLRVNIYAVCMSIHPQ